MATQVLVKAVPAFTVGKALIIKSAFVLQLPSAVEHATQYEVVPAVLVFARPELATPTGLKVLPEPIAVPPDETVYHSNDPGIV